MFKNKKFKGYSLIEIMVSLVIFGITLPIIYKTLFNTQSYLMGADAEVKLELEANTTIQYLIKDLKEATTIFDRNLNNISVFKSRFLADAVNGTEFTDKKGTPGSAILLMKYSGEKIMPPEAGYKKINQYELITYYMRLLPGSDNFYDSSLKMRSIIRLVSENLFLDPTPLNQAEREWVQSKGYFFWTPPKKGFSTNLPPLDQISFRKIKLTVNTSPGGFNINGSIVPEAGGLFFIQNDNNFSITISSIKRTTQGLKTFSLNTFITATSLII